MGKFKKWLVTGLAAALTLAGSAVGQNLSFILDDFESGDGTAHKHNLGFGYTAQVSDNPQSVLVNHPTGVFSPDATGSAALKYVDLDRQRTDHYPNVGLLLELTEDLGAGFGADFDGVQSISFRAKGNPDHPVKFSVRTTKNDPDGIYGSCDNCNPWNSYSIVFYPGSDWQEHTYSIKPITSVTNEGGSVGNDPVGKAGDLAQQPYWGHAFTFVPAEVTAMAWEIAPDLGNIMGKISGEFYLDDIRLNGVGVNHTFTISPSTAHTFPEAVEGYAAQTARTITVTNGNTGTATGKFGGLSATYSITLSGANADAFELNKSTIADVAANASETFTVAPKTGLDAGTYTATVNVNNGREIKSFNVDFTVAPKPSTNLEDATIALTPASGYTYTGSAITPEVTVTIGGQILDNSKYSIDYANNVNAGTATVTVHGTDGYTGSKSVTFTIARRDIANATVIIGGTYVYNTMLQTPAANDISVTISGITGDVTYTSTVVNNNADAGQKTLRITGTGNFTGTNNTTFTVLPKDISDEAVVAIDPDYQFYTGDPVEPDEVTVTMPAPFGNLIEGTHYTVVTTDNTEIGLATVTVTGTGNYTGTAVGRFSIIEENDGISIAGATVEIAKNSYYTGIYRRAAQVPTVTVKLGGNELEEGVNYQILLSNNINAGIATLTVTGIGDYYGTITETFEIDPKDITSSASIVLSNPNTSYTYTGRPIVPTLDVIDMPGQVVLSQDDYSVAYDNSNGTANDNINVGTVTITVEGKGNYTGTVSNFGEVVTFDINRRSISDAFVTIDSAFVYSGALQVPDAKDVKVSLGGFDDNDVDYEYEVLNNSEGFGQKTVRVTGKGNFSGTATGTFNVARKDISDATVEITGGPYIYNAELQTPTVSITLTGFTVTANAPQVISGGVNVGPATVSVTGNGNFTGTVTKEFEILPKSILNVANVAVNGTYYYSGSPIVPSVTVNMGTGYGVLRAGVDYDVNPTSNTNPGTAFVTVTGKGNFEGNNGSNVPFTINPRDISDAFVLVDGSFVYSGSEQTPDDEDISVSLRGVTVPVTYDVVSASGTDAGNVTVTVEGTGHFTGTATGTYTIARKTITDDDVTVDGGPYTYNGNRQHPVNDDVTVTLSGITTEITYDVDIDRQTNAGSYDIIVTGKGNFDGTVTKSYTIAPASIAGATVAVVGDGKHNYTGSAIPGNIDVTMPAPFGKLGVLDYTLEYTPDNINAGKVTVTVKGAGNFTGTATQTAEFEILPVAQTALVIKSVEDKVYGDDEEFQLETEGGSGSGDIEFALVSGPATVSKDGLVEIKGSGNIVVNATKKSDGNYSATTSANVTIKVAKADLDPTTITSPVLTAAADETLANVEFPADAAGVWSWMNGSVLVGGDTLGYYVHKARFVPSDTNYNVVENIDVGVLVDKLSSILAGGREVPVDMDKNGVVVPQSVMAAEFVVGPNPVMKSEGVVKFYRSGSKAASGTLTVYDAMGNAVKKVVVSDKAVVRGQSAREVGAWDLKDARGRLVAEGTYLVKGVLKTADGKREKVSVIISVR